jgi:hypothetical protein
VETPEGRAEYVAAQREFAERGAALRARLLEAIHIHEAIHMQLEGAAQPVLRRGSVRSQT